MVDMAKSNALRMSREEEQRKRDEAQFYSMQQQIDELRRQLKENLARQQWFEELYRQGEAQVAQLQTAQDRLGQDVAQSLHARQIDEGRIKSQVAELAQRAEAPEKQIRELRAQIGEVEKAIKVDREVDAGDRREIEDLQGQLLEVEADAGSEEEVPHRFEEALRVVISQEREDLPQLTAAEKQEESKQPEGGNR